MVCLPLMWVLPLLSSPHSIPLALALSLCAPLPFTPSLPLWTQIQSVIWSPCNGRVIGTLPWLVGNLGELCTGAICNIFSKLNFFLFLSPSLFISPSLLSLPPERLTQMGYFFTVSHISVLTFLFSPPPPPFFYSMLFFPAPFFSFSFPPLPP